MNKITLLLLPFALALTTPGLAQLTANQWTTTQHTKVGDIGIPSVDGGFGQTNPTMWNNYISASSNISWNYNVIWSGGNINSMTPILQGDFGFSNNGIDFHISVQNTENSTGVITFSWTAGGATVPPGVSSGGQISFTINYKFPGVMFNGKGQSVDQSGNPTTPPATGSGSSGGGGSDGGTGGTTGGGGGAGFNNDDDPYPPPDPPDDPGSMDSGDDPSTTVVGQSTKYNPDGSVTTTYTYEDGSTSSVTTGVPTDADDDTGYDTTPDTE